MCNLRPSFQSWIWVFLTELIHNSLKFSNYYFLNINSSIPGNVTEQHFIILAHSERKIGGAKSFEKSFKKFLVLSSLASSLHLQIFFSPFSMKNAHLAGPINCKKKTFLDISLISPFLRSNFTRICLSFCKTVKIFGNLQKPF